MTIALPTAAPPRTRTIALVGNPNTGKSTVFNALTGFRQRVGNYPGVTIERRAGRLLGGKGETEVEVIDLPGLYSLAARAEDEAVVLDVLLGRKKNTPRPELIVCVVDAAHLSRNLFLTTQILELGRPVIVALNMTDLAEGAGIHIDVEALSLELGVPVVPLVANRRVGIDRLIARIEETVNAPCDHRCPAFPECVCAELDGLCASLARHEHPTDVPGHRIEALQTLLGPGGYHENRLIRRCGLGLADELTERRGRITQAGESVPELEARVRYAWIDRVITQVVQREAARHPSWSEKADKFLTHRISGSIVLLLILGACFQAIYAWAAPLMDAIDGVVVGMGAAVSRWVPEGAFQSLLADGVIAGVGAVLIFLPQILILFMFIAVLEGCGYMARAAFLLDRWMSLFGLGGKSFIPLLSSFACAIPGIMATRSIEDRRDRFVTILIAPLMSCSARLPVYVLFIGAFIPAKPLLGGWVNLQAVTLLGMYMLGAVVAVPLAWLLKRTILRGPAQSFLMELPTYKWPSFSTVWHRMYEQGRAFVVNAGTVIFAVTVVIWAMGYYPRPQSLADEHDARRAAAVESFDQQVASLAITLEPGLSPEEFTRHPEIVPARATLAAIAARFDEAIEEAEDAESLEAVENEMHHVLKVAAEDAGPAGRAALQWFLAQRELDDELSAIDSEEAGAYIHQSILGRIGAWIEPVVKPLGWDWRIGTAVLASFPAREVIIATLGTIYNLGAGEDESSLGLREQIRHSVWPDGRLVFNLAVALSIMVFFALCCQCASTLAIIRRETGSWGWPLLTFVYMTGLAYVAALVTFQVVSRLA